MHEEQLEKLGSFSLRKRRLPCNFLGPNGEYRWGQTLLTDTKWKNKSSQSQVAARPILMEEVKGQVE